MTRDKEATSLWTEFRRSKRLIVFIIYVTLMLDTLLLSSVVPLLPELLLGKFGKTLNHSSITTVANISANNKTQPGVKECTEKYSGESLASGNIYLAALLASKQLVQFIANFAIGPISDRIGYGVILPVGYFIMIISSLVFAFGQSYAVLFFARALQGIASSCASTVGLSIVAESFPNDEERSNKIGIVLGGLGLGALIGPTFASVTYQFAGRRTPFLILAVIAFLVGLLQTSTQLPQTSNRGKGKEPSPFKLLRDPYVILTAAALTVGTLGTGALNAVLPSWILANMCPEKWMLGVAMLPMGVMYLLATVLVPRFTPTGKRWLACLLGNVIGAIGFFTFSLCKTFYSLIGPGLLVGVASGIIESTMFPFLGHLADIRHASFYGSVFALGDAAFSAAFFIGPLMGGVIAYQVGFLWVLITIAIIYTAFAPFVIFLRNPPAIGQTVKQTGSPQQEKWTSTKGGYEKIN